MNNPRVWIVILALVCFLAGVAAGLVGSEYARRDVAAQRDQGDFVRRFAEAFDLDPEGQRLLAERLAAYNSKIESIKLNNEVQQAAEAHALMEPELQEAGKMFREDIRDILLVTDMERAKFDGMMVDYRDPPKEPSDG